MFVRTENASVFLRLYPAVSAIVACQIIFFFLSSLPVPLSNNIFKMFIGFNAAVWKGEYWRLVTSLFLHLHLGHLIVNAISLLLFGPGLEKLLGRWRFLVAYIGSGMLANVATLFLAPPVYTHLGASGAIFGLLGVYGYLAFFHRPIIQKHHAQVIAAVLAIGLMMSLTASHTNTIAHLFGFLSGAILAPFLSTPVK